MKEEDLKGARSKLGLKGEVKSKTYEVMVECGEPRLIYISSDTKAPHEGILFFFSPRQMLMLTLRRSVFTFSQIKMFTAKNFFHLWSSCRSHVLRSLT